MATPVAGELVFVLRMFSIFSKIISGNPLKRLETLVFLTNSYEDELSRLSDEELKAKSLTLKERVRNDGFNDQIMPEAFALVREASKRTSGKRHYDVQIIGGAVLHEGKIAEMKTGEGKTLVATLSAYLNALSGEGVHVVTVNDYLARRDAVWMGQIYHALGLTVSCIVHDTAYSYDPSFEMEETVDKERDETGGFRVIEKFLRPISRREAYLADVTYGTNHEFGFDYLRDNLVLNLSDRVQRTPAYAIIDEVDSILIDEARTPLIIAAPDEASSDNYKTFANIVTKLSDGEDYEVDEKLRTVNLTDTGTEKVERALGIKNIFDPDNSRLVHFLNESLKAKTLFKKDKNYVVKDGEIIIVDEFTGRMLHGRRYSGGLHQAIEAKEGVFVKEENRTYAQITIQNYFRLYKKIAGMTGTAQTSAEEFHKVYGLDVVTIPTNRPLIRKESPDRIYKTKDAKYKAVAEEVKERHEKGQPVLIGTTSIENNETISAYLATAGIPHEVLNAKNNEREGAIIAQAGRIGAVTVATNMAGRGVDIILGGNPPTDEEMEKVKNLGGLHVIGTERHEARRIDNQLRGRSGRQGDPGSSQFFLSLEDDLVRIFGGDRVKKLMDAFNLPEDTPIEAKMISKAVNQAQQKVEGANFDARKHLLDFDDVLNKQRSAIYSRREKILIAGEKGEILGIVRETLERFAENVRHIASTLKDANAETEEKRATELAKIEDKLKTIPETIEKERGQTIAKHFVRIIDTLWVEHLENLESLRDSVNIRAYGQHEPLVEYRREAHGLFKALNNNFDGLVWNTVFPLFDISLDKIAGSAKNESKKQISSMNTEHVGRNDPCPCGAKNSDGVPVKYKRCHGA